MPVYSAKQILDKTLKANRPLNLYRVLDINNNGDQAKPVSNKLPKGYAFKVDSFLLPTEAYISQYGIMYARRKDTYFTFRGKDGNYYAVKNERGSFDKNSLKAQGILTVEDEIKLAKEQSKTPIDKLFEGFGKFATYAKWVTIGIVAIWATGYIIKSTKK